VTRVLSQSFFSGARQIAGVLIKGEIGLLVVIYAIFVFADRIPLSCLVAIGLLWIARWWATGRSTVVTPMDVPILGILVMVPVGLYTSPDWRLSQPKVYGIILGVAIFYAIVNTIRTIRGVQLAAVTLVLVSIAVVMLGLVGTDWQSTKLFYLPQVYGHLPKLIQGIPRSPRGGFSPNGIGGTLIFLIPVLLSLLWSSHSTMRVKKASDNRVFQIRGVWYRPILALSLLLTTFTLILTQSRGSFIGIGFGLLALAAWYYRRALWAIPTIALTLFVVFKSGRGWELAQFMLRVDAGDITVRGRMEVWRRAVYMIRHFPYTGIGICTFDKVANALYPSFISPDARVTHAHNELLQVAVDLGIPGLVAYVALLTTFALTAWRAYQALNDRWLRALIVGLACGMLAHQVFGLTDAFLLGTKPGVVMWVFMGLIAALYVHRDSIARQLSGNGGAEAGREGGNGLESAGGSDESSGGWLSSWLGTIPFGLRLLGPLFPVGHCRRRQSALPGPGHCPGWWRNPGLRLYEAFRVCNRLAVPRLNVL